MTAAEVKQALDSAGSLVAKPVSSTKDSDSAAVAKSAKTKSVVDVPKDPADGVSIKVAGVKMEVALPNADTAADATRVGGTVAYPSDGGAANAVVPVANGVQMLTTITSPDAPTRYDYKVDVPSGGSVSLTSAGGAAVLSDAGKVIATVEVPWAKGADGQSVPTHFETDGVTLTQVIEHSGASYPVVADPSWSWRWYGQYFWFNRGESINIIRGGAGVASSLARNKVAGVIIRAASGWVQGWVNQGYCIAFFYSHIYAGASFVYPYRC